MLPIIFSVHYPSAQEVLFKYLFDLMKSSLPFPSETMHATVKTVAV